MMLIIRQTMTITEHLNRLVTKRQREGGASTRGAASQPGEPGSGELGSGEPDELGSGEPGELGSGEPGELGSGEPGSG